MTRRVDWRLIVGLVLGVVLSGIFISTLDLSAVGSALRAAHPGWVILAAVLILGEWWLRGFRWQGLIQHVDPEVPLWTLVSATMIGAATNTVMPLRGGDLLRPAVVARRRNLSFATLLSSTVVERMFDIFGLCGVFSAMFITLPAGVLANAEKVGPVRQVGFGFATLGVSILVGALVLATDAAKTGVVSQLQRLPFGERLSHLYLELVDGLRPVRSPSHLARALAVTVVLWTNGLVAIWCLFRAFELGIPAAGTLVVEVAIALAVVVPQAPGFVGVFHWVMETTLRLWGANVAVAQAAAIVFWGVSFVPVTIWGLIEAYREGVGLLDRRIVQQEVDSSTSAGTEP
jgi:uncharacterized protein (TIRG00374 family)